MVVLLELVFPSHIQSGEGTQRTGRYDIMTFNPSDRDITLSVDTVIGQSRALVGRESELNRSSRETRLMTGRRQIRLVRAVGSSLLIEEEADVIMEDADENEMEIPLSGVLEETKEDSSLSH